MTGGFWKTRDTLSHTRNIPLFHDLLDRSVSLTMRPDMKWSWPFTIRQLDAYKGVCWHQKCEPQPPFYHDTSSWNHHLTFLYLYNSKIMWVTTNHIRCKHHSRQGTHTNAISAGDDLKLIDFGLSKFGEPSKKMEMRVPRGTATGSLIHGFGEMPRCFFAGW